jgi:hypothetical protein
MMGCMNEHLDPEQVRGEICTVLKRAQGELEAIEVSKDNRQFDGMRKLRREAIDAMSRLIAK